MYALITNQKVEKFPYSIGQLRKDNPQTSFPAKPSKELLESYGVFEVKNGVKPDYNELTQRLSVWKPMLNSSGEWVAGYEVIDLPEDEAKANQIRAITKEFESTVSQLKSGYSESEIQSWDLQIKEAEWFLLDSEADTPLLDSISSARGMDKQELSERILTNAKSYAVIFGAALGKKQKAISELSSNA